MLEAILDYEEVKETIEEEVLKPRAYKKKLALMRNGEVLQLFDICEDLERIEAEAVETAKRTCIVEDIDLCFVLFSKKYQEVTYKRIIEEDIVVDECENYMRINDHISVLTYKEVKKQLQDFADDIFTQILQDKYAEVKSDSTIYDNCVGDIYNQLLSDYENCAIIRLSSHSFITYETYINVVLEDLEDEPYYILTEDTKNFLIGNIYDKCSLLSDEDKREVEFKIIGY